jgi:hypothetical protein
MPIDDEFDEELAFECGLTEDGLLDVYGDIDGEWSRFHYVYDQWECRSCDVYYDHVDGPRHYWNPETRAYDGAKPQTPKERAIQEREQQEAAGQLRLIR